jgi:DNA-binding Lrp family transcriptional regulator
MILRPPSQSFYLSQTSSLKRAGIQEMPLAFVFINAELGSEDEILKQLRKIGNVKEAYGVYGIYDIVAKVEAEKMDELREVLNQKVRKVNKVRTTLTMIVIE